MDLYAGTLEYVFSHAHILPQFFTSTLPEPASLCRARSFLLARSAARAATALSCSAWCSEVRKYRIATWSANWREAAFARYQSHASLAPSTLRNKGHVLSSTTRRTNACRDSTSRTVKGPRRGPQSRHMYGGRLGWIGWCKGYDRSSSPPSQTPSPHIPTHHIICPIFQTRCGEMKCRHVTTSSPTPPPLPVLYG
jgi:hypothetical protein